MGALRFLIIGLLVLGFCYLAWKIIVKYFLDQTPEEEQIDEQLMEKVEEAELLEKRKLLRDLDKGIQRKKEKYHIDDNAQ